MTFYIDYLNKDKGFKQDRIYFTTWDEAREWSIDNLEVFNPDVIKVEF